MKKGYTLIELLGVIIILALLVTLVISSAINFIEKANEETDDSSNKLVINAAEMYIEDNNDVFNTLYGNQYCIPIDKLIANNYIKEGMTKEKDKVVKITYTDKYNYEIVESNSCSSFVVDLEQGLVPVIYNTDHWEVADTSKKWYNYENQEWANAVILNNNVTKKVGDTVTVDGDTPEAVAMFVWVPRYEYKIQGTYGTSASGTAGTRAVPEEIQVNLISKDQTEPSSGYHIPSGFTFGRKELNGIWVGKFETSVDPSSSCYSSPSANNCNNTNLSPRVLPNFKSTRYQSVSNQFATAQKFNQYLNKNLDSHLIRNSEWGAVAYLTQSKYGKYGNSLYTGKHKEIYINKSSSYTTGLSNGTNPDGSTVTQCVYNDTTDRGNGIGACGAGASTTGNITGIYDMSGSAYERVMGVFANSNGDVWSGSSESSNSGYSGYVTADSIYIEGLSFPNIKYYDMYKASDDVTISSSTACSSGICYGHALDDTSRWYYDNFAFVSADNPWFGRGGNYSWSGGAGIFASFAHTGKADYAITFRISISSVK